MNITEQNRLLNGDNLQNSRVLLFCPIVTSGNPIIFNEKPFKRLTITSTTDILKDLRCF